MARSPRRGTTAGAVVFGLFATLGSLVGQEAPPPVTPPSAPSFPTLEEHVLSNGALVLILPDSLLPWVDVSVVIPGGRAAEASGREGTADLVARTMTRGTDRHSGSDLAEALDRAGTTLTAVAGTDWITVSTGALTSQLDSALSLLSDVILRPSFPQTDFQQIRRQTVVALQTTWMDPTVIASRVFREAVYSGHPYGAFERPDIVREITADDLREYHRRVFGPDGAVVLVSGDVEPADMVSRLEALFSDWTSSEASSRSRIGLDGIGGEARGLRTVVVHTPGSTRAVLRLGHPLPAGDSPDWAGLSVVARMLSRGLVGRLRDQGWSEAAAASLNRRRGPGLLQIDLDVRVEVVDSVVAEVVDLLQDVRIEAPAAEDAEGMKASIASTFPLQLGTGRQVVGQVGRVRMFSGLAGRGADPVTDYWEDLSALTPVELLRIAREHVQPDDLTLVVVGDARLLRARLAALGPLRMLDVDGLELDLADLTPTATPLTTDVSSLGDGTWRYRISANGDVVGEVTRTLTREVMGDGTLYSLGSSTTVGPQVLSQAVVFEGAGFRPVSGEFQFSQGGQHAGARLTTGDGVVTGSRTLPDGRTESFETPYAPGALVGEMLEVALWMADLEEGLELVLPVLQVESGATTYMRVRVLDQTRVTVPAGRYETYRVEIQGGQAPQLVYARVEAPHIIVKLETPGQPFVIELEAGGMGGG